MTSQLSIDLSKSVDARRNYAQNVHRHATEVVANTKEMILLTSRANNTPTSPTSQSSPSTPTTSTSPPTPTPISSSNSSSSSSLLINVTQDDPPSFKSVSRKLADVTKQFLNTVNTCDLLPAFTQNVLRDYTTTMRNFITNLIRSCKFCMSSDDVSLRKHVDQWSKKVAECMKNIMSIVNASEQSQTDTSLTEEVYIDEESYGTGEDEVSDDEEEELDFVVGALAVFTALDELRDYIRGEGGVTFHKAAIAVTTTAHTLVSSSTTSLLIKTSPKLKKAFQSMQESMDAIKEDVPSMRHPSWEHMLVCVRNLDEAVGECVDEYRVLNKSFDPPSPSSTHHRSSSLQHPPLVYLSGSVTSTSSPSFPTSHSAPTSPTSERSDAMMSTGNLLSSRQTSPPSQLAVSSKVDESTGLDSSDSDVHPFSMDELDDKSKESVDPSLYKTKIFGTPLDVIMNEQMLKLPQVKVPVFYLDAVNFLRKHALDEDGLFLGSAAMTRMDTLRDKINRREPVRYESECDTRSAAALIFQFFEYLPTPIFAGRFEAGATPCPQSTTVKEISDLVHSLPLYSQHVICELFALLTDLCNHSSVTQPTELGKLFAPVLFPKYQEKSSAFDPEKAVTIMIQQFSEIFRYAARLSRSHRPAVDLPPISTVNLLASQPPLSSPNVTNSPRGTTGTKLSHHNSKVVSRSKKDLMEKQNTFKNLIRGSKTVSNFKLCVAGEKITGKHALVQKILFDSVDENIKTETIYSRNLLIDSQVYPVDIVIVDLSSDGYSTENSTWLQWAEGFIITIAVTTDTSLDAVPKYIDIITQVRSNHFPFVMVGSNADEDESKRKITQEQAELCLKNCTFRQVPYIEYSTKSWNIDRIIPSVVQEITVFKKLKKTVVKTQRRKRHDTYASMMSQSPSAGSSTQLNTKITTLRKVMGRKKVGKEAKEMVDRSWTSHIVQFESWVDIPLVSEVIAPQCIAEGYHVETGAPDRTTRILISSTTSNTPPFHLYPSDFRTMYYKTSFVGKEHNNYFGNDENRGTVVVSVLPAEEGCKIIVRTKKEDYRFIIPNHLRKDLKKNIPRLLPGLNVQKWTEIKDPGFVGALTSFEEQLTSDKYKFGVLLCLRGQTDESQMFGNQSTPEFDRFLTYLGDRIPLLGWKKFRGGLNVKDDVTGRESIYTETQGCEIMYHVSTLLPYQADDLQRVERKRHIGNDIVTIIFKEGDEPFSPLCLTTRFTHIFCVVTLEKEIEGVPYYRITMGYKPAVPPCSPLLSSDNCVLPGGSLFREFLVAKLINAERAALYAPDFAQKTSRTRKALLEDMVQRYN